MLPFASGKISFLPLFQKPSLVAKPECSREAPLCQHTAPKKFYFCRKRPPEAAFPARSFFLPSLSCKACCMTPPVL